MWLTLVTLLAVVMFHTANAQESAPQEPPFVQENEFDSSKDTVSQEMDDVLQIEDEIKQSSQPQATPQAQPQAPSKEQTVDLNKNVPEAGGKQEDLLLEDEQKVAIPEAPAVIPQESEPIPVKPLQTAQPSEVVRKSPRGGVEYIHHPQAAKGLMRIEKDGTYVYRLKEDNLKESRSSGAVRISAMDAPTITSSDGVTTFDKMYSGPTVPLVSFDYEWKFWDSMPNVGVQVGAGVMTASGNGRFTQSASDGKPTAGDEAQEKYTFAAIPLNLGLTYRFQYMDRQIIAPYIAAGGTYIPVVEYRDDGKSTNMVGTPGAYGAGGLLINVGAFDRETSFTLRSEYGIKNLWVTLEYRYLKSFSDAVDFSSNIIGAGVAVDY